MGEIKKRTGQENNREMPNVQPQAVDLEEAVLGATMLEKDVLLEIIDFLRPSSFYKEAHQKIYSAILDLNNNSEPIDILTVTNKLKTKGELDVVGGPYYITQLTNRVSSGHNIEYHARIIKQKEVARDLIKIGSNLIHDSYDETIDIFETTDKLLTDSYNVADITEGRQSLSNSELLRKLRKNIETAKDVSGITGITTGIQKKDELFGGYQDTHLIIKAGRPAMGKSADALSEADHQAEQGKNVLFISLEMSALELMQRRVSLRTNIPLTVLKNGKLTADDWKIYNKVTSEMYDDGLTIIDTPGLTLNGLRKIAKKHAMKHGLDSIYIDYLQLLIHDIKGGNREQEISAISRGLKRLAKEVNCPVIALAQLSRAVEQRGGNKKPILSDLRESGSIEQDADIVQFLYRPEYYGFTEDEDGESTVGKGYMIVAKNRHGQTKDIEMRFVGECTRFEDWKEPEINEDYATGKNMPIGEDFDSFPTSSQDAKEKEQDDLPF
jgi:replicative DNA helicase